MKVMHQALTTTLSYGNMPFEKQKVLPMASTCIAAINIDCVKLNSTLNVPIVFWKERATINCPNEIKCKK